ncbi:MAG: mechanosensitive ion channel [Gloeobacteraceae cyanobacterium ES-bin-144]|nr:mechanosensitive ion channel [Verrucomicrobiales bacterium]
MPPEFQLLLAKSVGMAIAIYATVWLAFFIPFRRITSPPRHTVHLFAVSFGIWAAAKIYFPGETWINHLGAVLIFTTALFLWVLLDCFICGAWLVRRQKIQIPTIIRQLGGMIVVLTVGSCILKWGYGLELTGLIATSGIAAVILGFAMQDLLSNMIAGFSIHVTSAYRVGDWLLLGDNGDRAEVTEINWRSTRLIDNDQVSVEIPNGEIIKNRIVNLNYPTTEHAFRLKFEFDYDVPPTLAKQAMLAATTNVQGILQSPPPVAFLNKYDSNSIAYELRVWTRQAKLYNTICTEIQTKLWYEMKRRNIQMPLSSTTMEIRKSNGSANSALAVTMQAENAVSIALDCLTPEETKGLVGTGKTILFGPGEAIVTCGESGSSMFVILDGEVEVIGKSSGTEELILATLGTGNCFGEMSLLTGEPRTATVRSKLDTLVIEIRKNDLSPLIDANLELATRLGDLIERRQRELTAAQDGSHTNKPASSNAPLRRSLAERILVFFGQSST